MRLFVCLRLRCATLCIFWYMTPERKASKGQPLLASRFSHLASRLVSRLRRLIKRQRRWPTVDHYPRHSDNVGTAGSAQLGPGLGCCSGNASQCFHFFYLFFFYSALVPASERLSIIYSAQFIYLFWFFFENLFSVFLPLVMAINENA